MLNLLLNVALIVVGLVFIAISIWGKRFYDASWAQAVMGQSHLCGIRCLIAHFGSSVVHVGEMNSLASDSA